MQLKDSQLIFESGTSLIYKAKDNGEDIIIKLLKESSPSSDLLLTFHNEYEYTKDISHEKIRKAIRKEKIDNKYALILEYFEGISIAEAFIHKRKPLHQILEVAVLMADALSHVHQLKIIHKDITKDNILVNLKDKSIRIIDFGLSSKVDIRAANLSNPDTIDGNLFYISPEQTGRMNRKVDYRSDLYSFGVLLYEMLTGHLPFTGEDSLEIVHKHMTEVPIKPSAIDSSIPEVISNIVMILLSKNAENRYQSSIGLKNDLETCYNLFRKTGRIDVFQLSIYDYTGHFTIPEKLYGRQRELEKLMGAFANIKNSAVETLFVSGYSGVGKSALINETHIPITKEKGYFIKGKYDQFQKNVPYYAFTEAINEFCRYLLSETTAKLELYKKLILDALGELGQIVIDIAPKLELIIGPQPPVTHLDAIENANRFNTVFIKFIRAISLDDHPLVMFLDDLQWADTASIQVVKQIIISQDHPNFLLIGAYRDNEVDKTHPLSIMIDNAKAQHANIEHIHLQRLSKGNVRQMISEILHDEESPDIIELTEEVYKKTQGNAFFTIQLITSILNEGFIKYNISKTSWDIDITQIRKMNYSENVVEFMASKLVRLPEETLSMLKLAACIGNQFDINILSRLYNKSNRETFGSMKIAIEEELIVPLDEDYQLLDMDEDLQSERNFLFNFAHDRIQQAAYSRISKEEAANYHYKIARILLAMDNESDYLFETVHQFNNAIHLIEDDETKLKVADLNYKAAVKARNATAYASASNYIEISEKLLGDNSWKTHYKTTLGIKSLGAEVSYLQGQSDKSDNYIKQCLTKAKNPMDRTDIYYLKMLRLTINNHYGEAIDTGRQCLEELGFTFPRENLEELIGEQMTFLIDQFQTKGISAIGQNPNMTDPTNLAIIKILDNFSMPTYVGGYTNLWILQACMKVTFSIENGNTPETAYAFSELGLILNLQGMYDYALQSGELSKHLATKFEKQSLRHKARSFHLIANYIFVWHRHVNDIAEINDEGFRACIDSGELIFAGYTNFHPFYNKFYSGSVPLLEVKKGIPDAIRMNEKFHMDLAMDALISIEMCIDNLTGENNNTLVFVSERFAEEEFIEHCQNKKDYYGIATLHTYKACALYINEHYLEAQEAIKKAYEVVAPLIGSIVHFTTLKFYEALIEFQLYDPNQDNTDLDNKLNEIITSFESFSKPGKANIEHKLALLKAERCRLKHEWKEAEEFYMHAIAAAKEYGFLQNEAISHELLGRFWLGQNKEIYAHVHFEKSAICYYQWGALPKYEKLKKQFPEIFVKNNLIKGSINSNSHNTGYYSGSFDIKTLFKASQVLAEEIRLPDLLAKTLNIISVSAGADRCAIILRRDGNWFIEALSEQDSTLKILNNVKMQDFDEIPQSILSYCIRTKDEFIMKSNTNENLIMNDGYIQKVKPKSVAVVPSFLKKELRVLLYIENSVTTDAFSSGKLQVLHMLSGQIAISIENARLYENMNNLNQAYQKFVPYKFLNTLGYKGILGVKLGDHKKQEMTAIFSDIRDYTSLSEAMTPQENFDFMNSYLNTVGPIIERNDGIVMQFIGDGILSLFANASDALNTAIESQKAIAEFNKIQVKKGQHPIKLGFGIHTGLMILGVIGDEKRRQAGVISSEINTVSRIEGLNKMFGTSIILSEVTLSQILNPANYNFRLLGKVQVKGQQRDIKIYDFFDGDDSSTIEARANSLVNFNKGLNAYFKKDFIMAAGYLKKVLATDPNDVTAERYLRNAAEFIVSGVPNEWSGVEKIASK